MRSLTSFKHSPRRLASSKFRGRSHTLQLAEKEEATQMIWG